MGVEHEYTKHMYWKEDNRWGFGKIDVVVVSDRHTSSVSPYGYPESRDEQKPGPERRDCEAFVIPPKGLMQ